MKHRILNISREYNTSSKMRIPTWEHPGTFNLIKYKLNKLCKIQ